MAQRRGKIRKRQQRDGCALDSRDGKLRFRFRYGGRQVQVSTGLDDTAARRAELEPWRRAVARIVRAGADPRAFLAEHLAHPQKAASAKVPDAPTIATTRERYAEWIVQQVPPLIRKAQRRDYRRHLEGYVLTHLGEKPLHLVDERDLYGLQATLLKQPRRDKPDRTLSVRFIKNIVMSSLRSFVLWAMDCGYITADPFPRRLKWPRPSRPSPDPYLPDEVRALEAWFATRKFGDHPGRPSASNAHRFRGHLPYAAYVHVLLWTGMRPSEASGLTWGNVDLVRGTVDVRASYHLGEMNDTKTVASWRTVEQFPKTVALLGMIRPDDPAPDDPVFTTLRGGRIEPKAFSDFWYEAQTDLGIRKRGLYCTKDTFVTNAITLGCKIGWLENQTGVAYATLKRHYGKWLSGDRTELNRFALLDASLLVEGAARGALSEEEDGGRRRLPVSGPEQGIESFNGHAG